MKEELQVKELQGAIITGATGAIGIALTKLLSGKGIPVLAVIRTNSSRRKYIHGLPNVKIVECDLSGFDKLPANDSVGYDVIFDLAWEGSDQGSRQDPAIQKRNIDYISAIIGFALRNGCNTFIGAGSQAEYGRVSGKINEDYPLNPVSEYGKAKLQVEELSRDICKTNGIRHIWTRIFSVFGPGMGMDSLITYSISEFLKGNSPQMTKGEQLWDFMYAADAALALYLLAVNESANGVYCVASGEGKSIKEYTTIIRDVVNPEIELHFGSIPYSENQVMELIGDISKLKRDTGFKPSVLFEVGIKNMAEWMKSEVSEVKHG